MKAAGLREVEKARREGRWDRAYDSPRGARIPADFAAVLKRIPRAKAFFAALDKRNRYAVLYRIQNGEKGRDPIQADQAIRRDAVTPGKDPRVRFSVSFR